jgi:predicted TIM-barrel fold metal-dependent hydrolase
MIPAFAQRVAANPVGFQGPEHAPELQAFNRLKKSPTEYFQQNFYADTTVGAVARTIQASIDFFGPEHVLFASDWPFGPVTDTHAANIGPTLQALESLGLSPHDHARILADNARHLRGVPVS